VRLTVVPGRFTRLRLLRRLRVVKMSADRYLGSDDILVTHPVGSQLCSIDTVRLVDRVSHFPNGFVTLGEFVPYRKAKLAS
jgi:hypothetical protein